MPKLLSNHFLEILFFFETNSESFDRIVFGEDGKRKNKHKIVDKTTANPTAMKYAQTLSPEFEETEKLHQETTETNDAKMNETINKQIQSFIFAWYSSFKYNVLFSVSIVWETGFSIICGSVPALNISCDKALLKKKWKKETNFKFKLMFEIE